MTDLIKAKEDAAAIETQLREDINNILNKYLSDHEGLKLNISVNKHFGSDAVSVHCYPVIG